jgi:hypothetical protein
MTSPAETTSGRPCVIGNFVQAVTVRHKRRLCASVVLVVCIGITIGYFTLWKGRNVTVYDDNFRILDCSISSGTTHMISHGNQTVGHIKYKLWRRFGLNFRGLPLVVRIGAPKCRVLLLRYEGDLPFAELDGLRAVLTNGKNISRELAGRNVPDRAEQTLIAYYILPALPTSEDSFRIDLKLKSADDPVASYRIGRLYRRDSRNNSGQ